MLCKVRGKVQRPDGQPLDSAISFRPARSGTWDGNTFAPSAVTVSLGADGSFVARLVPSAAVGEYEVVCGAFSWVVAVPDSDWAEFAVIARAVS